MDSDSPAPASWLEALYRQFDDAWQKHPPGRIEAFFCSVLEGEGRSLQVPQRRQLLEELICIDLEYRWKAAPGSSGDAGKLLLEDYVATFPEELETLAQVSIRLIVEEFRVRRQFGDRPAHEQYLQRFPGRHAELPQALDAAEHSLPTAFQGDQTLSSPPSSAREGAVAPPVIPGYEILDELGRGGMGVVYKARQTGLDRIVALKMILAGGHAGPGALARFRTEGEAIARLRHPNIVQVYEVGQSEGQPFFSLEYCPGGSLNQKWRGTPQPPREAAALVETLARAMEAAHRQNVIHRDLKPANVLQLEDGTPKITDFGLAKKLDESGQTNPDVVMGTPSFMAPEQAACKTRTIGPAADVYALGAILYAGLTGGAPFKGATPLDTLEQVRTQDPVPPSRTQPKTPRDLETICLKCLQKDATQRYDSAEELAEDLRRFLEGKPIKARPVRAWERTVKLVRRWPGVTALLTLLAVSLLTGTVVSTWMEMLAERRAHEAETQTDRARRGLKLASASLNVAVNKITQNERLSDRGFFQLRKELLNSILPHYEELAALKSDDPELESDRAQAYGHLGMIHWWLGENEEALAAYHEMESVFDALIQRRPDDPAYLFSAAAAHQGVALVFDERGATEEARTAFDASEKIAQRLAEVSPDNPDHQILVLQVGLDQANWLMRRGRHDEALGKLVKVEQLLGAVRSRFPNNVACQSLLARLQTSRGYCYKQMDRRPDAEKSYRDALAAARLFEGSSASHDQRYMLGLAWSNLGTTLEDPKESCDAYQKARAIFECLRDDDPGVPSYPHLLAGTYQNLATAYDQLGDPETAEKMRRLALQTFEKQAKEFPLNSTYAQDLGVFCTNMGYAALLEKKMDAAQEWFTKSVNTLEPLFRQDPQDAKSKQSLANAHRGFVLCLMPRRRHVEAISHCDRALALDSGENRQALLTVRNFAIFNIRQASLPAQTLARQGDHVKAVAAIEAVLNGLNAHPETDYNAACVYSVCAAGLRVLDGGATGLPASPFGQGPLLAVSALLQGNSDELLAEVYAARAVALLKKAQASGLFDDAEMVKNLQKDEDLNMLRGRPEFKRLLADVVANAQ